MPFLTPEQTGGPAIFALRRCNYYLAMQVLCGFCAGEARSTSCRSTVYERLEVREFDVRQLAKALGRDAGETWQEHAALILRACCGGKLFDWLDRQQEV